MNYKAVLFDMDGVIVDSEPLHGAAFQLKMRQVVLKLVVQPDALSRRYDNPQQGSVRECNFNY